MNGPQQVKKAAVNAAKIFSEPFETLRSQVAKPLADEFGAELGSFFGSPKRLGKNPKTLAQEDLQRARQQEEILRLQKEDSKKSAQYLSAIKEEYRSFQIKNENNQTEKITGADWRDSRSIGGIFHNFDYCSGFLF